MNLQTLLQQNRDRLKPVFSPPLHAGNSLHLDLSANNREFDGLHDEELDRAIEQKLADAGVVAGVGGYLERRSIYADTDAFQGDAERCIHIGVDVFMPAGTWLHAPLDGRVHSFANRSMHGDYGPVIILQHELDGMSFHSLYGHLAETSLDGLSEGRTIVAGEAFAQIGPRPNNGNWPPHLHFQLIHDLEGSRDCDYVGVVRAEDVAFYRENCPDPNALLVTPGT